MKRLAFLAVVALLLGGVGQAKADSYSVSTGWSQSMTVQGFDTSMGTLTSVSIQITGSDALDVIFVNQSGTNTANGTAVLNSTVFAFGPDSPSTEATASATLSQSFSLAPHGTDDFSGNETLSGSSVSVPFSHLSSYETATVPLSGAVSHATDFLGDPVSIHSSSARPSATVTLTYTFTPNTPATPEPAALTLLGIGAAGLLGYGWRQRRRAPV
jgi:hypothetical protein